MNPEVLDMADATGTSSPDGVFGYRVTMMPARGGGRVARADLRRYARLLLDGAGDDDERVRALIVPGDG